MINLILKISKHLPNKNIGAYLIKMQQKYSKIQAPKKICTKTWRMVKIRRMLKTWRMVKTTLVANAKNLQS
jgi:hypothetical protein